MGIFQRFGLKLVIFLTGASVLVLEVVAVRVLSPYFGNTIFNFSSVLSTILASLSVGYYLGGRLGDKNPSERTFFSIIAISGGAVLVLQSISILALPILAYYLSIVWGPLISSFLFFAVPSCFLGFLSPYLIALQKVKNPEVGVGLISGEVFLWGTVGSLVGSLGSGFYLIPVFGTRAILSGVGLLLLLLGMAGLFLSGSKGSLKSIVASTSVLIIFALSTTIPAFDADALFAKDGIYERISVVEQQVNGKMARILYQDKGISGGIYPGSSELPYEYASYYKLHRLFKPELKKVLAIGGGAYIIPSLLMKDAPDAKIEVVEIEPFLIDVATDFFGLMQSKNLQNIIADGRRYLHDSNGEYDFIINDTFHTFYSIPSHLVTFEFFTLAREKLSNGGVFLANVIGSLDLKSPSLTFSIFRTFLTAFPNGELFAVKSSETENVQNLILLAVKRDSPVLKEEFDGSNDAFISAAYLHRIDLSKIDLNSYYMFTDDWAPVDWLSSQMAMGKASTKRSP